MTPEQRADLADLIECIEDEPREAARELLELREIVAERDRLRRERDEAVASLREFLALKCFKYESTLSTAERAALSSARELLARIGGEQP